MASLFTDKVKVTIKSGDGGDGMNSFKSFKGFANGGPDGGDGGKGGDVYVVGDKDKGDLTDYRFGAKFAAGNGERGGTNNCFGKGGEDRRVYGRRKDSARARRQGRQGQRALYHRAAARAAFRAEGGKDAGSHPYSGIEGDCGRGTDRLPQRGQEHTLVQNQRRKAEDCELPFYHPFAQPGGGEILR